MGNKIARTTQASATEYYLHDLPSSYNLVLKEVLGRARFLKSIQCKHDEGLVIVKVYFKRGDSIDLRDYERRLSQIRDIFSRIENPHVWPFQFWLETDKAAYLLRQYFFSNLHDRLSTRPFLSLVEKKWLAFQLLYAVKQSHDNGVCHGDIKCENVLVTSWNWLYLADFASFKPTYIPHDDPSDFSFFFDTGGRRRCYLAPERFYENGGEIQVAQDAPLRPSMDIFSVGCVIAELFLEGQPLFELSQLLAYRRGQFDPSQHLEKIPDSGIRKMILQMIQLDPESRCSAESYLQSYAGVVLPCYFSPFLHNLYSNLNPINPDSRVAMLQLSFPEILKQMLNRTGEETDIKPKREDVNPSENSQNHKQGKVLQTISNVFKRNRHPFLREITMSDLTSLMSDYDNQSDTFGMPILPLPQDNTSCEGMVLIASLLCSCVRNVKTPQLRRSAVLLLKSCSLYIDDEDRLQRVLPYVIVMLSDSSAIVRSAALETLCDILPLVRDFPPSDAKIFPEYILPMLSMLPDDPEESVRICYANNISKLALTAYGFLVHSISLTEAGVLSDSSSNQKSQKMTTEMDAQLAQLRKSIAEVIQELVMGPKQTPSIRRALLQDIGNLCWFFGQRQSNDFLLPILPAFLNDQDELLRSVFYRQIVYVCFFVGQRSVEEYLLPYLEQALGDSSEGVIVNSLDCLSILCTSGFLRKRVLLGMLEHAFLLLCHPSQWVRKSVVTFIAASSETLGAVDSYVFLVPLIRPFLRRQPSSLASEKALFLCLKPPVSSQVFYQMLENNRSSDMLERQRKIWYNNSPSLKSKELESDDMLQKGVRELDQLKMRPDRDPKSVTGTIQQSFSLGEIASLARTTSGSVDILDPLFSDKLMFSGFMSPQISGANSFVGDKSSDGIPLYYFKYDKKTPSGNAPSAPEPSSSTKDPHLHRVVHELEDREPDQTVHISNKFQEVHINNKFQETGSLKGKSVVVDDNSNSNSPGIPNSGWRPRGVLVAHLQEHRSAVNDIALSTDQTFFVTASDDSTVKVWDSRKLEKDISFKSKLTYCLDGSRALCTAMIHGSAQVVVGASDGTIHTFSVDYVSRGLGTVVEKYSGITDVKKNYIKEGAILTLLNYSSGGGTSDDGKMILYSTQNCGIHLRDTRENTNSWNTKVLPEEGYVCALAASPCGNWFVSGSSRGVLTLWDLRFGVPVNSWQYSVACPIANMCRFVPSQNSSSSSAVRPLVYVAAGCNEVSLWDAENGSCHQVLRIANDDSDAEISNKTNSKVDSRRNVNLKYREGELNEPPPRSPGIRSLLPLPGGDLLTGGTDLKIRRWDHCSPERTYCICGPSIKGVGNDEMYEIKSSFGVQVVQESKRRPFATKSTGKAVLAAAATDSGGCHRDSILSLASVKLNQRLLLSSSRDGSVKVWK